jgi:YidC/Oxa1 family membrane protein insertase
MNNKNTVIGFVLIFAVLMIFNYINKPSEKQIEAAKHRRDSIELVKQQMQKDIENQQAAQLALPGSQLGSAMSDSANASSELKNLFGDFGISATGLEEFIVLENNLLKLTLSTKGGKVSSVELKNYKRYDSSKLFLIEEGKSVQNLNFFAQNRNIKTDQFFFKPLENVKLISVSGPSIPKGKEGMKKYNDKVPGESKTITLRLDAGNGRYIDYIYTIEHNSYVVKYDIKMVGMDKIINTNTGYVSFNFNIDVPRQERPSNYGEDRYSSIYYKFTNDEINELSLTKSDNEELKTPIKWIAYKQLFFSTILIADDAIANATVTSDKKTKDAPYIATFKSDMGIPFEMKPSQQFGMSFYFGPNHYQTLKSEGNDLQKLISLGWPVVREVNRYLIIPVFNFLRSRIANFGLIILILTILIRIIVFPFTYKSYISQAKMKALKPEIDEINKKIPADKPMDRQQATMALYKKVGVSPLGGCLPMLFQMPILIAMFFFFPGSIELRQESFLWATDLSTYDAIFSWKANIPLLSSIYGNHVSLFALLMTITTILQTKLTGSTQDTSAMPGMKYIMYFMPIVFLFILNSYSSGLSYYYFLSNVFTIGQTYIIRYFIDDDKVRAQLQAQKLKKPAPKSKFQQRLEEVAKQQQMQQKAMKKR